MQTTAETERVDFPVDERLERLNIRAWDALRIGVSYFF